MKRNLTFLYTLLVLFSINIYHTQSFTIPNNGFENWSTSGSTAGKANSWSGYGDIGLLFGLPNYTIVSTYHQDQVNKNSGTSSIRIQNQYNTFVSSDIEGLAWLGSAGTSSANVGFYGIPFSHNIQSFSGYFRYIISSPTNKDTALIICQTTKFLGGQQILVKDATFVIPNSINTFSFINSIASGTSNLIPDTLWIAAYSSYWPLSNKTGSASLNYLSSLWMDDLTLTTVSGITAPVLELVDTRLGPNPANDFINFSTSSQNIGGNLKIYDALGREIAKFPIKQTVHNRFSVEFLSNGLYVYKVYNSLGEEKAFGKFLISR
ncbi:MAG: T9SS type A sorting domain-containing protein [Bacteroidia bacterium]|nr:T9SS type A sorting domain-containing protein [Bacteroidia bacterium]